MNLSDAAKIFKKSPTSLERHSEKRGEKRYVSFEVTVSKTSSFLSSSKSANQLYICEIKHVNLKYETRDSSHKLVSDICIVKIKPLKSQTNKLLSFVYIRVGICLKYHNSIKCIFIYTVK